MTYEFISKIASGTFGTVYKVKKSTNGDFYALKLIHENYKNPKELKRIKRGFESAQKVSHPNCVKMIEWFEDKNEIGFVMEFVDSVETQKLASSKKNNSVLETQNLASLKDKITKIIQIANGLEALHSQGIVHRDLKPANILETKDGQIKITDFDLIKIDNASTMTASGDFLGTLKYSSPEQCNNSTQIDSRSDLYSLGIIFYELLTGVCPINGESLGEIALAHLRSPIISPRQIIPDLPPKIEKVVLRLLEKNPKDRFQSASEVSRILNECLKDGNFGGTGKSKAYLLPSVFVSRKEELKTLEHSFTETTNGSCKNIFISGELGVGKTRLWEEFKLGLNTQKVFLLETQFSESGISLEPLGKLVSKALDSISKISDREKINAIGKFAWDLVKIYPPLLKMPFMKKIEKVDELGGVNGEFRLFETLIGFLTNVSKQTTLIFYFEDLQWADELSAKFLLYLTRNITDNSCLIVGSHRKVENENSVFAKVKGEISKEFSPIEINLNPISVIEIVQMLTSIFGKSDPVETKFAEFIFKKTKGNPLFVKEIIFNLFDKNLLTDSNGNWNLDLEVVSKVEIPNTVFSVLNQRLNLLEKETLKVLQLASILGEEFGIEILSKVLNTSEQKILDHLATATILNFVEKVENNYSFVHGSIRETLQKNLESKSKKALHKEVGEYLENKFSEDKTEVIEELANHFYFGEVEEKAISYSIEAAEILSKKYANSNALSCLDQAINLLEKTKDFERLIDCHIQKIDILEILGKFNNAKNLVLKTLEAAELLNNLEKITILNGKLSEIYYEGGSLELAKKHLAIAINGNKKLGNNFQLGKNYRKLANYYESSGKVKETIFFIEKSLKIFTEIKDKREIARVQRSLAKVIGSRGNIDKAEEILLNQLEVCQELNDQNGIAHSMELLGSIAFDKNDFTKTLEYFTKQLRSFEDMQNKPEIAKAKRRIGLAFLMQKNYEKSIQFLNESLKLEQKIGNTIHIFYSHTQLGETYFHKGDFDKALENLEPAINYFESINRKYGLSNCLSIATEIYYEKGEFEKALESNIKSRILNTELDFIDDVSNNYFIEAKIYKDLKDIEKSEYFFNKAIEVAIDFGNENNLDFQKFFAKILLKKIEFLYEQNRTKEAILQTSDFFKIAEKLNDKKLILEGKKFQLILEFESGNHSEPILFLQKQLSNLKEENDISEIHYWLSKLGVKSYDEGTKILNLEEINFHKEKAIQIYEKLFSSTPRFLYKSRIEELKSIVFHPHSISPQLLKSLVKWMNPETVFSELLKFLSEECKANGCQIILKNANSDEFEVCAISPNLKEDEIDFSTGILKEAIETKRPILIEDATHSEKFQSNQSIVGKIFLSVIAVPLEIHGEICGALYLHRTKVKSGFFLNEDLRKVVEISKILSPILFRQQESVKLKMDSEIRNFGIIGNSPKMHSLFEKIKLTVNVNYPIYIHGETGTGKELVAKALHEFSDRKSENFVVVNCSTIPKDLAESELFGFEKGSFSGASAMQKGKFELSDGGTLFLDEIGELTLPIQSKILRAIQEKEIWRVGGQKAIKIDLRIIVATHKNLEEEVQKGNFREDLYHRLNVVKLEIPPLRERAEDILVLANHFLKRQSKELGKKVDTFTSEAIAILQMQDWKGNVRELENTIAKALILKTNESPINSNELGLTSNPFLKKNSNSIQSSNFEGDTFDEKISILERKILVDELEKNDWNKSKTATSLRLTRDKLYRLLNKHQLLS